MNRVLMALVVLGLAGAPVFGAQIFVDHFSYAEAYAQTASFGGWTVIGGNVDFLGTGSNSFLCDGGSGNGGCIDTDGTSFDIPPVGALTISRPFAAAAAGNYVISFRLGAPARDGVPSESNTVRVLFGGLFVDVSLTTGAAHAVYTLHVPGYAGGATSLVISHLSASDNAGLILDDVAVDYTPTDVPEPSTWAMIATGVGLLMLRRRS